MNHDDFEKELHEWSIASRIDLNVPKIDVRHRIAESISAVSNEPIVDFGALGLCAAAVCLALSSLLTCYAACQTVLEPWAVYFL